MARIKYMLGDSLSALNNQHKATLILERVLGTDHPGTVCAYINLALYCHACNQSASALRLLYRCVCTCVRVLVCVRACVRIGVEPPTKGHSEERSTPIVQV